MTGLRRTFFAALAAFLRWIACAPLGLATVIERLADRCEQRARDEPRSGVPP